MTLSDPTGKSLDRATAERLAAFGDRDIDVTDLAQRIEAQLNTPGDARAATAHRSHRWLALATGLAASVLLLVGIFALTTPTQAQSISLDALHQQIVTGQVAIDAVDSIDQANDQIADQLTRGLNIGALHDVRIQSCCLANVDAHLAAATVLHHGGVPLTLTVAEAPEFAHPMGIEVRIDGTTYFGHEVNGIPMIMANRDHRWLCVMGQTSYETLAQVAHEITF